MRKLYTLIACVSCICSIYAQQGDYLLTQHFPRHSNLDNSNFEIINDGKGRICVANRSGVLKYDGESWDFYATPSAALSLAVDTMDAVYVGCIGTVGVINFQNRKIQYQPLVDTINDLFLETHRQGDRVFFLGNKYLISYSISTEEIKKYEGNFLNMYSLDGALFVNSSDGTTYQLLDSLTEVNSSQDIAFISSSNERPDLIINFQGELYSYQDLSYDKLPQNKLIQEGGYEIQEAHWINDTLFVCSTFESGLLFFNTNQPEKIDITDYHSGLPDNEIFTIHCINEDVWAAHEFGITQISPLFPAYSYTHFQGLEGNLTSISLMNDKLWVTTSLGLYHFAQDTIYENKVYYEVIKKSRQRPTQKKQKPEATAQKVTTQKKEKKTNEGKPVLKRLFGKKKRATTNLVAKESQEEEIKPKKKSKGLLKKLSTILDKDKNKVEKVKGKLAEDTEYRRRIQKIPVDVEYSFDKIEGTNGKFLAVLPYRDKLLAVSTSGIYEIKEDEAEVIIEENIETFTVNHLDQLIISTSDLSLKFYKLIDEVWIELMSEPTDDIIVALKEDSKDRLWLAGSNTVYKTASTDTSFQLVDSYQLDNAYLDRVTLFEFNEKTYFINSNGYFFYDEESNTIEEDKKLKESIGSPIHHLFDDSRDAVWVYTGKIWHCLSADGSSEPFEYMGLFPDLRWISSSYNSQHLWLITQENDILKYDPTKDAQLSSSAFFLRKVSNEKGELDQSKKFVLDYDENFLSVELSKPDFLGLLNPEFQYKLQGLNSEWSDWTRSKTIDFSYLPEGNYALFVRSRDSFGRTEEGKLLEFSVTPPYWQTPWFYAIQILFFGGLVYFSSRLNQNSSQNRLLRGALTLLTLVLIIEFLQSAISSLFTFKSTPFIDFLIDAMIAFMIFPLERLLRELMTKGKVKVPIKKEDLPLVKNSPVSK